MCFHGLGVFWNMSDTACSGQRLQRNERPDLLEVSQELRVLVTCKFKCGCLLKVSHVPLVGAVCGNLGLGSALLTHVVILYKLSRYPQSSSLCFYWRWEFGLGFSRVLATYSEN